MVFSLNDLVFLSLLCKSSEMEMYKVLFTLSKSLVLQKHCFESSKVLKPIMDKVEN